MRTAMYGRLAVQLHLWACPRGHGGCRPTAGGAGAHWYYAGAGREQHREHVHVQGQEPRQEQHQEHVQG